MTDTERIMRPLSEESKSRIAVVIATAAARKAAKENKDRALGGIADKILPVKPAYTASDKVGSVVIGGKSLFVIPI